MELDGTKELYFDQYCKTCRHAKKKEDESPCDECLAEPVNQYSHKPFNYDEAYIGRVARKD